MNCNSCNTACGNNTLWLLILALVLSGKHVCLEKLLCDGCTPILLALAYCLGKSGTLSCLLNGLFDCNSCGCNG